MNRMWYNIRKFRNYRSELTDLLSVYKDLQTALHLHLACQNNHVQVAEFLISNGADMNIKDKVCSEEVVSLPSGRLLCVFSISNLHMFTETTDSWR